MVDRNVCEQIMAWKEVKESGEKNNGPGTFNILLRVMRCWELFLIHIVD